MLWGILRHKDLGHKHRRSYSRIARNRKFDRLIAGTSLAARSADTNLQTLREELDQVLEGKIRGNPTLYGDLLRRIRAAKALPEGIRLHNHVAQTQFNGDVYVWNLLVQMYGSCGCLERACSVFQEISSPNSFSWNIMVAAYAQNGHFHGAYSTFKKTPEKDIVTWSTMIAACVQNGQGRRALALFREMDIEGTTPTKVAFLSVLEACAATGSVKEGRQIHAEVQSSLELSRDAKIQTAIVNFYGKCGLLVEARSMLDAAEDRCIVSTNAMISAYVKHGQMDQARELFDSLESPNVSTWNSMIKGYAQLGHIATAVDFLKRMDLDGIQPNTMTLLTLFDACATIPAPAEGKLVHASVDRGFDRDGPIATALVYMYGRSGGLDAARAIFDRLPDRDVAPWTAMIASYAHNGHGAAALELFQRMALDGSPPNAVTFNTILCACSHSGALFDARGYFLEMQGSFGIRPDAGHFGSMMDLLGRAGKLGDAEELAYAAPGEPGSMACTALMAACSTHGDAQAAGRLFAWKSSEAEPHASSPYVLLHNIFTIET